MPIKSHKGGRVEQLHARLTPAEKQKVMARVAHEGFSSFSDWLMEKAKMAKIVMASEKEIEFKSVDEARKYAAFDETTWPCDIVDDGGNVIEHFG